MLPIIQQEKHPPDQRSKVYYSISFFWYPIVSSFDDSDISKQSNQAISYIYILGNKWNFSLIFNNVKMENFGD